MKVNYKNPKFYNTARYPIRQPIYLTWLIWVLSKIMLFGKKRKIERIGMDGLKPPYLLLSNHMSFIDFELVAEGTYPQRLNNVVNIDGYYMRPWLMEWIGAICTRKFTNDMFLIRSIKKVLDRGDVLCMYPEARYSQCGITSYLPDSLGTLVKRRKVPVVIALHHGNHLHSPVWNVKKKRKVPLYTTITKLLTPEDIESMSPEDINNRIRDAFEYDDYKYQKDNNIQITEPYRAEGLHKILYKCPNCMTEFKMDSKGVQLFCKHCGKKWSLNTDGTLTANDGKTEFSHVPDWFRWERDEVRREIELGQYSFKCKVDVHSMPHCWRFIPLGTGTLTHDPKNGFVLEGYYNGENYRIQRTPLQTNSLHVEYSFPHIKPYDCIDISTENDSFYCYPDKENVVTKLSLATEEIYQINLAKVRTNK
ncbi:MAG: 1-acyl-sn-glycerol-3-phosphate acyltransferase [Clostridia bacterium]|nr:1-acyl-sn-glycerol-3-phosphate acyltransferase [Clostridia bacterium]